MDLLQVVRHFQLMALLKRVAKIYMEKKLLLTQEDHVADIAIEAPNARSVWLKNLAFL